MIWYRPFNSISDLSLGYCPCPIWWSCINYVHHSTVFSSDNGLAPSGHQAIPQTNDGLWVVGPQEQTARLLTCGHTDTDVVRCQRTEGGEKLFIFNGMIQDKVFTGGKKKIHEHSLYLYKEQAHFSQLIPVSTTEMEYSLLPGLIL